MPNGSGPERRFDVYAIQVMDSGHIRENRIENGLVGY
jgi:hypothetical protein